MVTINEFFSFFQSSLTETLRRSFRRTMVITEKITLSIAKIRNGIHIFLKISVCPFQNASVSSETAKNGTTVIVVTHNTLIAEIADRVIRLKNGKVRSNELNPAPKAISEVSW